MAFMFETKHVISPTAYALGSAQLQADYYSCWSGIRKNFNPEQK
jgi:homogentisate 1,2-dioxygenase